MLQITYVFLFLFLSTEAVLFSPQPDANPQINFIATLLLNSMNKSVDPCDNFYDYACGNWDKNYPDSPDMFTDGAKIIRSSFLNIVEQEVQVDDIAPLKYEKLWFQSCMNYEKDSIKPLEDTMNQIGGWPIVSRNEISNHEQNWQEVNKYYMATLGIQTLFSIFVRTDDRNGSTYIIEIKLPEYTFYENLLNDENVEHSLNKYETFIKKVASLFARSNGNRTSEDDIEKDVKNIIDFENQLHMIQTYTQEYLKISELQKLYDQNYHNNSKINWLDVIQNIFKESNISIADSEEIYIVDNVQTYLQRLSNLLDKTQNRIIVNYIHWQFILSSITDSNRELLDLFYEVNSDRPDGEHETERRDKCFDNLVLKYGIVHEYFKMYYSEEKRKLGFALAFTICSKMIDRIQQSSWLDDLTKKKAINKISKLTIHMGYLNILSNETYMEHMYDQFAIGSSFYETNKNFYKFDMKRNLQLLRKYYVNDIDLFSEENLEDNGFYMAGHNSILLTASMLITPLLDLSIPPSVNFGNLGFIIGHEIGHALDPSGRLYDEDGNYINWWSENMTKIYENKSQCFVHQFNNYSWDGNLTLDENVADTIGLQISYDAFKSIQSNIDVQYMKLPGLEELSDDQLFFVSFANNLCQTRSANWDQLHSNDTHSPNNYRLIGSVSNSGSFASAFNCPPNAPMNPITKCDLWN